MKIIYTLIYIVTLIFLGILGNKLIKTSLIQIKSKSTTFINIFIIQSGILFISFFQYWLLTEVSFTSFFYSFPFRFLFLLIALLFLTVILNEILLVSYGIASHDRRHKINLINSYMGVQQSFVQPLISTVTLLIALLSPVVVLCLFWTHQLRDEKVFIWTAILIFILPQINSIIMRLTILVPIVTSEFIDDDVRKGNLSESLSSMLYSIIFFIFPFIILHKSFKVEFAWLPKLWIIASIPLILFLLIGVIPFFLGLNKYKTQFRDFLKFRKTWLDDFKHSFILPVSEIKLNSQKDELEKLDEMINEQLADNKIEETYEKMKNRIQLMPQFTQLNQQYSILQDERKHIEKWNLQLSFVTKLKELKDNITPTLNQNDLEKYIDVCSSDVDKEIENFDKLHNKKYNIITVFKLLPYPLISGLIIAIIKYVHNHYLEISALLNIFG